MNKKMLLFCATLLVFSACVTQKVTQVLPTSFDMVSNAVKEAVEGEINPQEKVLIVNMDQPFDSYIQNQYFQNGVIKALTDKDIAVIDITDLIKEKRDLTLTPEYFSTSNLFLMNNWDTLKTKFEFDKVLEYSVRGFQQFGTDMQRSWGFMLHLTVYSANGNTIMSKVIPCYSEALKEVDQKTIISKSNFKIYDTVKNAVLEQLDSKSLDINNALIVFNDFTISRNLTGEKGVAILRGHWNTYLREVNQGVTAAITEARPESVKLITNRLYKKRLWQYEKMALNSTSILIKEGWTEFAEESGTDLLITYRFLATPREVLEYFKALSSNQAETQKDLKMVFRIVDLKNSGKLKWSGVITLDTAPKEDAKNYDFVDFYDIGKKYGRDLVEAYTGKISDTDLVALVNLDTLMIGHSANEIVFDDGMIEGILESSQIRLIEKGRGFLLHPLGDHNANLDTNPIKFLQKGNLIHQNINKIIFYSFPEKVKKPTGQQKVELGDIVPNIDTRLVDVSNSYILGAAVIKYQ